MDLGCGLEIVTVVYVSGVAAFILEPGPQTAEELVPGEWLIEW